MTDKLKLGAFTFTWWQDEYGDDRSHWVFSSYPERLCANGDGKWSPKNLLEKVSETAKAWAQAEAELRTQLTEERRTAEREERAHDEAELRRLAKKLGKRIK